MRHKTQPILDVTSLETVALEVLTDGMLPFEDEAAMIEIDAAAIRYGAELARKTRLSIYCNIEYTTLMLAPGRIAQHIELGMVIELVERHDHEMFNQPDTIVRIQKEVERLRLYGARIALDDVTPTAIERSLIDGLRPDIVKVESVDSIKQVLSVARHVETVVERIETKQQAELARTMRANQIQGYWCDRIAKHRCDHAAEHLVAQHIAWGLL